MKAIKYLSCILLMFTSTIYTQIPDTVWTKTFGGPLVDVGNSVKQTNDGGFIIAGTTSSFGAGGQDIYLIKTDEYGDTLWTKTFGGTGTDGTCNVRQTNDGGYAIFGTTNSYGNGDYDFLLWKVDATGNTQWFKTYGTSYKEYMNEGQQTFDGGFILGGYYEKPDRKGWIVKTDSLGNEEWNKMAGVPICGLCSFSGNSIQQTPDGGYLIGGTWGYYYLNGYRFDWFIQKFSSDGDSLFYKTYTYVGADFLKSIRNTTDGNLILAGVTMNQVPWLLKLNYYGSIIWSRILTVSHPVISVSAIEPLIDNGFIIAFTTQFSPKKAGLLKTDNYGILTWELMFGGSSTNETRSVYPTNDDGYIVAGLTNSSGAGDFDVWLVKFNYFPPPEITVVSPNGGEIWLMGDTVDIKWNSIDVDSVKIQLSLNNGIDWMTIIDSTPSDSLYEWVVQAPSTSLDCLMKISNIADSTIFDISDTTFAIDMFPSVNESIVPEKFGLYQNFPNPFNPTTKIKFTIPTVETRHASSLRYVTLLVYDVLGNEVATLINEEKQPGTYEIEFYSHSDEGRNLTSGIYFYQLRTGNYIKTKKMVLMK